MLGHLNLWNGQTTHKSVRSPFLFTFSLHTTAEPPPSKPAGASPLAKPSPKPKSPKPVTRSSPAKKSPGSAKKGSGNNKTGQPARQGPGEELTGGGAAVKVTTSAAAQTQPLSDTCTSCTTKSRPKREHVRIYRLAIYYTHAHIHTYTYTQKRTHMHIFTPQNTHRQTDRHTHISYIH